MPMFFMSPQMVGQRGAPLIVQNSMVLTDDDVSSLSKTYSLNAPWTLSTWVRRSEIAALNNILGTSAEVYFNSSNKIVAESFTSTTSFASEAIHYHIHVSDEGLYVNGIYQGAVTTTNLSNAKLFDTFDGYVSNTHLRTGTISYDKFGEDNGSGKWLPKGVSAGEHYLMFANPSNWGENSGSAGDWAANSIASDALRYESPSDDAANGIGQFPIWDTANSVSNGVFTEGNTLLYHPNWQNRFNATIQWPTNGKWYFEVGSVSRGLASISHEWGGASGGSLTFPLNGSATPEWRISVGPNFIGARWNGNTAFDTASGTGCVTGSADRIGIHVDADNNAVWCTHNGDMVDPAGGAPSHETMWATVGTADMTYAMIDDAIIGQASIWLQTSTTGSNTTASTITNFGAAGFDFTRKDGFEPLLASLLV